MIIDLNKIPLGIAENQNESWMLKSGRLVRELLNLNQNRKHKFTQITIPPSILNIIELHQYFKPCKANSEIESPFLIGQISQLDCFVDIYLPPNKIIFGFDVSVKRDLKIQYLVDGELEPLELEIEVIY